MEKLVAGAKKLGFELNSRQLEQFDIYYRGLIDWSKRINLTAITDYEGVQVKHFLDSLTVTIALKEKPCEGFSVIDVGTGAGLPGIPLKILFPDMSLVLLEARAKKADFLHHITRRLGLGDIEIAVDRAEVVAHGPRYREQFDLVLSRAVASLSTLVELSIPFCKTGGVFIAQKKGAVETEIGQAKKAIETLGGNLRETTMVDVGGLTDERYLVVIEKVSPTPALYPRRPGMPAKRPIE